MKSLNFRDKDIYILTKITEHYLRTGKAVSSGVVVENIDIKVSSATIRNIMAKLEQLGYLYQPHTSAGRIPTDKGLRFYVNHLFDDALLNKQLVDIETADFDQTRGDFLSLLTQVSMTLAECSDNIGFVISPRISKINFKHVRLIKISEERVLIIQVSTNNLVLNEVVETKNYFTQHELDRASRFITESFAGKNLTYVRDYLIKEMPKYRDRFENILQKTNELLRSYFGQEEKGSHMIIKGTSKLLNKSEFFEMEALRSLFSSFEEKSNLAKLLSDFISLDRVKVLIGEDLKIPDVNDCSLILSHYGDNLQVLGSLGIIGPKRIPYKTIIPLVDYIAQKLSHTISLHH
ncbi:MAG: heat-inducible transcription repressor HrcA [Candidatus Aminicenantes bacterium]|nr:heat-inducible transcription repressor HrcA [Candidatus Aminicenantes bacterium]